MNLSARTDQQVLKEIARRIKHKRLRINMTQAEAAEKAGLHYNTLSKFEQGHDITLLTFIQILRALNELETLENFIPEPEISPIEILKRKGKKRQRASGKKPPSVDKPEW